MALHRLAYTAPHIYFYDVALVGLLSSHRFRLSAIMRSPLVLTAVAFAAQAVALPAGDGNKGNGKASYEEETRRRADAVKDAFQTAWNGYYECVLLP